jgi:hypothetical protein
MLYICSKCNLLLCLFVAPKLNHDPEDKSTIHLVFSINFRTGCNKGVAFAIMLVGIALASFALLGTVLVALGGLPTAQ